MTDEKIKNSSELEFAVFCIENVAAKLGVDAERVYQAFTEQSDILYKILFIFINGSGFTACFDHHAYIFFTNLFFRFVRIDTEHP